ncbi:hypothetical protein [Desulfatiferula olefinivorans]
MSLAKKLKPVSVALNRTMTVVPPTSMVWSTAPPVVLMRRPTVASTASPRAPLPEICPATPAAVMINAPWPFVILPPRPASAKSMPVRAMRVTLTPAALVA